MPPVRKNRQDSIFKKAYNLANSTGTVPGAGPSNGKLLCDKNR